MNRYQDIIDKPKPISQRHRSMPHRDRAKIFAPFAALKGHDSAIAAKERIIQPKFYLSDEYSAEIDSKVHIIQLMLQRGVQPQISLTFFRPIKGADEGEYIQLAGIVHGINIFARTIQLDREFIGIDNIYKIEIDEIEELNSL